MCRVYIILFNCLMLMGGLITLIVGYGDFKNDISADKENEPVRFCRTFVD